MGVEPVAAVVNRVAYAWELAVRVAGSIAVHPASISSVGRTSAASATAATTRRTGATMLSAMARAGAWRACASAMTGLRMRVNARARAAKRMRLAQGTAHAGTMASAHVMPGGWARHAS